MGYWGSKEKENENKREIKEAMAAWEEQNENNGIDFDRDGVPGTPLVTGNYAETIRASAFNSTYVLSQLVVCVFLDVICVICWSLILAKKGDVLTATWILMSENWVSMEGGHQSMSENLSRTNMICLEPYFSVKSQQFHWNHWKANKCLTKWW